MKTIVAWALWLGVASLAQAEGIVEVLQRSHETRLAGWTAADADSPRARRLRETFDELAGPMALEPAPELRVVTGDVVAETLRGRVVVVNEILGDLPRPQLVFLLGHELGHVAGHHWSQLADVYRRHIPGEVTPQTTDPVAATLGREAAALSHRQELEADRHGLAQLQRLGYGRDEAVAFLMGRGLYFDTATHPGTRKRIAQLREADRTEVGAVSPATSALDGL